MGSKEFVVSARQIVDLCSNFTCWSSKNHSESPFTVDKLLQF